MEIISNLQTICGALYSIKVHAPSETLEAAAMPSLTDLKIIREHYGIADETITPKQAKA